MKPIESTEDLHGYFQMFAKPAGEERVGIECELFGVHSETGEALPYSGLVGIERVLDELAYEFGYEPIREQDHTIALQKGNTFISLEPGGQVELSAEPVTSIHRVREQLDEFFFQLKTISHFVGSIAWITSGIHPFSSLRNIEWVPKRRYQIMARYLSHRGKQAHDMMKRTATNQVNLDYLSEEDAIRKMRISLAITPIAAAMFANSSISLAKPSGYLSERLHIWRHTDPARCGLIFKLICEHCSFQDYLNYVLDVPMMFFVRDGKWVVTRQLTFRKFIERGYQGFHPAQSDFELHLSTIFTEARFKQYMEIRGMDGQRSHLIPAISAFWKGILYDSEAERSATRALGRFREADFQKLHRMVERLGLKAKIRGQRVLDLARELVRISEKGLVREHVLNREGQDESIYLGPLKEEILKTGKTPAEQALELWTGPIKRNRRALIDYLKI
ncbi:MAG: glutamate--cysteine ligase [Candidatus Omnitrophica bacterium]|nr:glutamate--cysteine ligase [Candidatus Omnitrophota bacterium]